MHPYSKASAWTTFTQDNLAVCGGNQQIQPVVRQVNDSITIEPRKPQKGLYISMMFGGTLAQLPKNHLIVQATFSFLGITLEIDISIKPGPEKDGGGMFCAFTFNWKMGSLDLGYIKATMDFVPLDLAAGMCNRL